MRNMLSDEDKRNIRGKLFSEEREEDNIYANWHRNLSKKNSKLVDTYLKREQFIARNKKIISNNNGVTNV